MIPQQKQAYIDPIRTVMLVDEQFLNIAEMAGRLRSSAPNPPGSEVDAEAELWLACQARGWACDVEKGPYGESAFKRIERCDLIVLDYHLEGTTDASVSLRILGGLARSPRSNLVVMYTNDPKIAGVKRRVAATLRGSLASREDRVESTLDELEPTDLLGESDVDQFLSGDLTYRRNEAIRSKLQKHVSASELEEAIDALIERYLQEALGALPMASVVSIECSAPGADFPWVHTGNVFIVFVKKTEKRGDEVFLALESALKDWNPPPLVTSMAYARHLIADGGFQMDVKFLSENPALHTGWLLQSDRRGVRELVERALSEVMDGIVSKVASFSQSLISLPESQSNPGKSPLDRARELARVKAFISPVDVYLALNVFLCSEHFVGQNLTTGTIFRSSDESGAHYWICATPACDMVVQPDLRKKQSRWADELQERKLRVMTVLRSVVVPPKDLTKCLGEVTKLKHVFFRDADLGIPQAIEVLTDVQYPSTEQMFAANLAAVGKGGRFTVFKIDGARNDRDELVLTTVEMVVVGQLRKPYAARLLQAIGHHGSRIGIDFEKLPPGLS